MRVMTAAGHGPDVHWCRRCQRITRPRRRHGLCGPCTEEEAVTAAAHASAPPSPLPNGGCSATRSVLSGALPHNAPQTPSASRRIDASVCTQTRRSAELMAPAGLPRPQPSRQQDVDVESCCVGKRRDVVRVRGHNLVAAAAHRDESRIDGVKPAGPRLQDTGPASEALIERYDDGAEQGSRQPELAT